MKERVRALTGTGAPATSLQAEGTITQTDHARFHLKLVTRSGGLVGERSLDASSCENLTGAAAVSLALLMRSAEPLSEGDLGGKPAAGATEAPAANTAARPSGSDQTASSAQTAGDTSTSERPGQQSSGSGPARTQKTETETATDESDAGPSEIIERPIRTRPRTWRVLAELPMGVMSVGPLPKPSWGLAFAGGASFDSWRVLLGGSVWLRQNLSAESPDYGADVARQTGTVKACRALDRARFEVAPCFSLSLEHISARGTGAGVTGRSEQAIWLAVGAGVQGRLSLSDWLSVLIGADAQIETARPVLSVDGAGEVGQLGFAAFTASVAPEWIF